MAIMMGAKEIKAKNKGRQARKAAKILRKDQLFLKRGKHASRESNSKTDANTASNRFSVVESYKSLRTNLQFSMTKKGSNVIIITSTMPKDGKSTVAANTAVAFAQTGIKVLVIDCDMRKPRINKFFNVASVPGLSNILVGLCSVKEGLQKTEFKNLHIVPSGILPPNPTELLMSTAMEELIDGLRLEYDLIILDTPPVNVVSDAINVTKIADGVVLVVRHAVTTHPDIERAIKSLEFVNAKIIGFVLNAIDYSKIYRKNGTYYKRGYGSYDSYGDNHNQPEIIAKASPEVPESARTAMRSPSGVSFAIAPERVD